MTQTLDQKKQKEREYQREWVKNHKDRLAGYQLKHKFKKEVTGPYHPYQLIMERTQELFSRFYSKVKVTETDCWLWQGATSESGYGMFSEKKVHIPAHRWIYLRVIGPIPENYQLDHLCRVRNCVNPLHLEPVTSKENTLRGNAPTIILARANKCKRGHDLLDPTIVRINSTGFRSCKICTKERYVLSRIRLGKSGEPRVRAIKPKNPLYSHDVVNKNKTHCPKNHPYNETNTYIHYRSDGSPRRHCKVCQREAALKCVRKKRAALAGKKGEAATSPIENS